MLRNAQRCKLRKESERGQYGAALSPTNTRGIISFDLLEAICMLQYRISGSVRRSVQRGFLKRGSRTWDMLCCDASQHFFQRRRNASWTNTFSDANL